MVDVERAHEVDGIRGWAALAVLLFHLFHETFGTILPMSHSAAAFAFIDGPLAVFVFFVLSGDALSMGFLRSRQRSALDSLAIRRYFRLTIPVAMSCLILFVLVSFGMASNKPAGVKVGSGWLSSFMDFHPTLLNYLRYVLVEVYSPSKIYGAPATPYNPMLWTMPVELGGSLLVFLFWYLSPGLRRERSVLAAVTIALLAFGSYYSLFFLGMLLSTMRTAAVLDRFRACGRWQLVAPVLLATALFGHALLGDREGVRHISILCAVIIVFCAYTSGPMLMLLRSRVSRYLGEVSFPLYLTHLAVIISFTSQWVLAPGAISPTKAIGICIGSAIVCLLIATLFRQVEKVALAAADKRLNLLVRRAPLTSPDPQSRLALGEPGS